MGYIEALLQVWTRKVQFRLLIYNIFDLKRSTLYKNLFIDKVVIKCRPGQKQWP